VARLFERAALIRITPNSEEAVVEYAHGLEVETGDIISTKDPLSPFKAFGVEIKSTNLSKSLERLRSAQQHLRWAR